ncbi:hypothetical protein [Maribacter cobaltidurans]|uniref:Uncharacterized protein n=1 Tax=Maribacter cobaltidurans TaxID=1178778 RepID=A0A223VB99_9FLAO|nr:hypothetical protein [Maribacter cobaltidurans]ASV32278.1 hypothetical protein CJ263_19750 [Maribacter cobaltidurans]GGD94995.1 hypothetical protein GCM10011412_36360 [Maribacter cobaltidurans]
MSHLKVSLVIITAFIFVNLHSQENTYNYSDFQAYEFVENGVTIDYSTLTENHFGLEQNFHDSYPKVNDMLSVNNDFHALNRRLNMEYPFKRRRHPLEKTGRILTYIGVPLAIIEGIMVAGADELYYECVNGNCYGDARGGFGVVILGAGTGLAGTGTVLWVIGSKK